MKKVNSFTVAVLIWFIFLVVVILFRKTEPQYYSIVSYDTKLATTMQEEEKTKTVEEYLIEEVDTSFYEISESDRYIIECVVAGESKGESFEGKKLVAQCIMNAMIRNDWDAETVRVQYQYAGWEPELENNNPKVWAEVELAVSEVFDKGNLETYEPILYFYNPDKGYSKFHEEDLTYVLSEGGHKFFKLKGE